MEIGVWGGVYWVWGWIFMLGVLEVKFGKINLFVFWACNFI